jgi:lipooligosaccharide transport system permease protein
VSAATTERTGSRLARLLPVPAGAGLARMMVERNITSYRHGWIALVTGFAEPVFYLFSLGIGIGALVQTVTTDSGMVVTYPQFVAPALLAASAMNGAVFDSTFNVFFKLKYDKLYDQMLATPLTTLDVARGEIFWGQLRGASYSAAFLVIMWGLGLVHSWWAVLALPAALLIGFAFSAVCMALTTYMKSWQDFDKITLAQLPMFLFSGTFFPVTAFHGVLRWIVEVTPLYRGVVLCRELTTGVITWESAVSVVYLVVMGLIGLAVVRRRLDTLLLT